MSVISSTPGQLQVIKRTGDVVHFDAENQLMHASLDYFRNIPADDVVVNKYHLDVYGDGHLTEAAKEFCGQHRLNVTFHLMVNNPTSYVARGEVIWTTGYLSILESLAGVIFSP